MQTVHTNNYRCPVCKKIFPRDLEVFLGHTDKHIELTKRALSLVAKGVLDRVPKNI